MRAATYIMNDDLEGAEAGLTNGSSSFHKVDLETPTDCLNYRLMVSTRKNVG